MLATPMLLSDVGTLETEVTKPLSAENKKGGTDVMRDRAQDYMHV